MLFRYNQRSTTECTGSNPPTIKGVVIIIRENCLTAKKLQVLWFRRNTIEEVYPKTEFFIKLINGRYKIICYLHKKRQ